MTRSQLASRIVLVLLLGMPAGTTRAERPLRALLVAGGCCHDYPGQSRVLTEGISKRARVEWTVSNVGRKRDVRNDAYAKDDWAAGYDVVVHNECYGGITDVAFVEKIAAAHRDGLPGVVIHCSMHSYRNAKTDLWRECLGVTSRRHERHRPLTIDVLKPEHPILKTFPDKWRTPNGELYMIEKVWPGATPLAKAHGADTKKDHVVIWTNRFGKGRIFGTTLGHHTETMVQDEYLDMVTRGLLWACDRLGEDGEPAPGYAATPVAKTAGETAKATRILLIGHKPDHAHGTHMYMHECGLLATCLKQTAGVEPVVSNGWPKDRAMLDGVDAVVLYTSPGGDILLGGAVREDFEALMKRGAGLVAIHWATGDNDLERGKRWMELLGGWFNTSFSSYKVTESPLEQVAPDHPVCRGWKPFVLREEYYTDLRFAENATPVLRATVQGKKHTVAWSFERAGGGRSFGTTLGHFHDNFTKDPVRRAIVNGILWAAGREVPKEGAPCEIGPAERELGKKK